MLFKCWIRKEINSIISDQNRAQQKELDLELKWKVVTEADKIIENAVCWEYIPFSVHNAFISRLLYMNQITISAPWARAFQHQSCCWVIHFTLHYSWCAIGQLKSRYHFCSWFRQNTFKLKNRNYAYSCVNIFACKWLGPFLYKDQSFHQKLVEK